MNKKEGPADVTDIMTEAAEARAEMLPIDMVNAFADLLDPAAVAKEMPWLAGELTKIALGKSDISFDERDKRFTDEAWRTVPYFRMLGQSYRLFELWMNRMYESVDGSWQNKARARFMADVIAAAMSPTNYLGTNPAALREAIETSGLSLIWPAAGCRPWSTASSSSSARTSPARRVPWCTGTRCSNCCNTSRPRPRSTPFRC
jgi:hypothetical protein